MLQQHNHFHGCVLHTRAVDCIWCVIHAHFVTVVGEVPAVTARENWFQQLNMLARNKDESRRKQQVIRSMIQPWLRAERQIHMLINVQVKKRLWNRAAK